MFEGMLVPRERNYASEYRRRIAGAPARGLSLSQARGHPRAGEKSVRPPETIRTDNKLEAALKALHRNGKKSATAAAKEAGVSSERFRRFLRENGLAERRGQKWHVTDRRPYRMTVISDGAARKLILSDPDQRSLAARHLAAVQQFLRSNDIQFLLPFQGHSVIDAKGKSHPLETDPNTLHRIAAAGSDVFHEIYRLIQ